MNPLKRGVELVDQAKPISQLLAEVADAMDKIKQRQKRSTDVE